PRNSTNGVIVLSEGPLLLASRPILTSENQGPAKGTLIMGRWLDAGEIEQLAQTTHLSLSVLPLKSDSQPRVHLSTDTPIAIERHDQTIAGYGLVPDLYGNPALMLQVTMPRKIYQQGQASLLHFVVLFLIAGVVFGTMILVLLEKTVLSRISSLSSSVAKVGLTGNLAAR